MKKPTVLILCASNPDHDPRPNRMIHWLKERYQVTVLGETRYSDGGVEALAWSEGTTLPHPRIAGTTQALIRKVFYALQYVWNLIRRNYEEIVWSKLGRSRLILQDLLGRNFDLIVSHDCTLLPFAFALKQKSGSKILFDAREYYTRDFEEELLWRIARKPVFQYLCDTYLNDCDRIITVSEGLSREYAREFRIRPPDVVMSLPYTYPLKASRMQEDRVRIIYHGAANASRQTEVMVAVMDYVDARFTLDLMLVPTSDVAYWRRLTSLVKQRDNVRIIPPVPMQEIVPFINQYDIGLFLCPPANLNLEFVLPNKLFEYIQARLAVAIGPNVEMKRIVERYGCGIVTDDFEPRNMAQALNVLTAGDVMMFKERSHRAASELNAENNQEKVVGMVAELLG